MLAACGSNGPAAGNHDAIDGNQDGTVFAADGAIDRPGLLGAVFVTVADSLSRPVSDVVITTEPATVSASTDALGSVLLRDIPAGIYAVTGLHPTQGSARLPITVMSGQITRLDMTIRKTPAQPGAPTVAILMPVSGAVVFAGSLIPFRAQVSDDRDAPGALALQWRSSIDGVLGTAPALSTGQATLTTSLSVGVHVVTLKATDSDGLSASAAVSITVQTPVPTDGGPDGGPPVDGRDAGGGEDATPVVVSLAAPTKDSNGINLSWTATPDSAVTAYRLYRSGSTGGFEVIDLLSNPATITYRDEKVQLGINYSYRVGAVLGPAREVQSNIQMVTSGVYITVDTQVTAMMVDKKRPFLYAVDTVNNSLLFVNLSTNKVDKTIFVGSRPADLDINQAGTELFIANFGATDIAVVNLDTQEKARSLTVDTTLGTWDGNPYRLACTAGDTVVFTSEDQWNNLKLVNAMTGANLSTIGSIYQPELVASPDGTHVYMGESGISTVTLQRYDILNGKLQQADTSGDAGSYGGRSLAISGDGVYLFFGGKKFLAKNLKSVLGSFSEPIVLSNNDGSIAIGAKNIFNANTFAVTHATPLSTSILALSADEATLYLYDNMTSRLYLYKMK